MQQSKIGSQLDKSKEYEIKIQNEAQIQTSNSVAFCGYVCNTNYINIILLTIINLKQD